ncbi:MAG: efflux RND transporter periplasmic adaptor subunit [Rickettsiales bacterium]|nr:efflux RND transporter periplasmic adaptor subunit [Rickettsiales bacterium]
MLLRYSLLVLILSLRVSKTWANDTTAIINVDGVAKQQSSMSNSTAFELGFVVDQNPSSPSSQNDAMALRGSGIKGQLQPARDAVLSSQMTGQIIKIHVKENQYFKKNATLVEFGCIEHNAELKKSKAVHKADETRVSINDRLNKLASISQLDYKLSVYKAEESDADVRIKANDVKHCKIKAPYAGVVEEVLRKEFEYVQKGDPVIKILDDSMLEIELLVPSNWVTWIKKDVVFEVVVSEIDQRYEAKLTGIGAKIDPISQSIMVKGIIENQDKALKPGMSITAHFKR